MKQGADYECDSSPHPFFSYPAATFGLLIQGARPDLLPPDLQVPALHDVESIKKID